MKILVFAAVAVAFLQVVSGDIGGGCSFNPQAACDKCDFSRSYVQYVANPCNCNEYYSCEKTRGYIYAHKQNCAKCLCFSDETWGCTIYRDDEDCTPQPLITEIIGHVEDSCYRYGNGPSGLYLQRYREATGDDRYTHFLWIVDEYPVKMLCPPGTYFNFTECKCLNCFDFEPCVREGNDGFCVGWDDFYGSKKVWYDAAPSCAVSSSSANPPHALVLNGQSCDVEVPYFQKNEFSEFTLCVTFQATGNGPAGLAFDGGRPSDDCYPSISLGLDGTNHVIGEIYTGGPPFTVHGPQIALGVWYSACLRYDGHNLEILLGSAGLTSGPVSSNSVQASGNTAMNNCNMLIGANVNQNTGAHEFFQGEISKWCFSRKHDNPVSARLV